MTKLDLYLMLSDAVEKLASDMAAGRVPPQAGIRGLAYLMAKEAEAFKALMD